MHCVSSYPAEKRYLNLNVIDTIKEKFDQEVGYSDHSLGDEASLAAVAKGAKIIEKHVTISRKFNGPDHKSSMTILELKNLVKKIRILELILGSRRKNFSKDEKNIQKVARKSLVSARELKKNTIIKKSDILFKRPGTGISPNDFNKIIGKKIKRTIKNNRLIMLKNIK